MTTVSLQLDAFKQALSKLRTSFETWVSVLRARAAAQSEPFSLDGSCLDSAKLHRSSLVIGSQQLGEVGIIHSDGKLRMKRYMTDLQG